ncbi:hypothetical protein C8R48DRAFT_668606 [Suillus tomentosus]|nr:hypothetical protein C8R48DRAFT_668606 [Suillus tomentosus]
MQPRNAMTVLIVNIVCMTGERITMREVLEIYFLTNIWVRRDVHHTMHLDDLVIRDLQPSFDPRASIHTSILSFYGMGMVVSSSDWLILTIVTSNSDRSTTQEPTILLPGPRGCSHPVIPIRSYGAVEFLQIT